jgi:hypothetical protein
MARARRCSLTTILLQRRFCHQLKNTDSPNYQTQTTSSVILFIFILQAAPILLVIGAQPAPLQKNSDATFASRHATVQCAC